MTATPQTLSLKQRSIRAASWSLMGYGASQVIRLLSNLVMTRLLAPEYFGLMGIFTAIIIGLNMFSDIGLGPNIVQSARGHDQKFLNTAWTLQFLRGVLIWLLCVLAAWPMSVFYDEPLFLTLMPVAGLLAVTSGLISTKVFTAQKRIDFGMLTWLEIGSQLIATLVMIGLAQIYPSVWPLVIGALLASLLKTLGSHLFLDGESNRFSWDAQSKAELLGFARWIFVSSILSYFATSAGSLVLGKLAPMETVGVFGIAITLSRAVDQAFDTISSKVALPVFSEIKYLDLAATRQKIRKVRLTCLVVFLPPVWVMAVGGQQIVDILFDQRYSEAGWMLQVMAISSVPLITSSMGPFYLAQGNPNLVTQISAVKLIAFLAASYVGWELGGVNGLIYGMTLHTFLVYAYELVLQKRFGILMPAIDCASLAASAAVIGGGMYFMRAM